MCQATVYPMQQGRTSPRLDFLLVICLCGVVVCTVALKILKLLRVCNKSVVLLTCDV